MEVNTNFCLDLVMAFSSASQNLLGSLVLWNRTKLYFPIASFFILTHYVTNVCAFTVNMWSRK